jgi:hypothetical protein
MQNLCKPAILYVIVEAIMNLYLVLVHSLGVMHLVVKALFVMIWVVVLQFIYNYMGWQTFTWVLVGLPIFFYVTYLLMVMSTDKNLKTTFANNFYVDQYF